MQNGILALGVMLVCLVVATTIGCSGFEAVPGSARTRLLLLGCAFSAGMACLGMVAALRASERARRQAAILFQVSDMLHGATTREDAGEVVRNAAIRLLGGFDGSLLLSTHTGDRVLCATGWGARWDSGLATEARIDRNECWGLKRQRPQLNETQPGALRCVHARAGAASLEMPLVEQGELHGLLILEAVGPRAEHRLRAARDVATQLADALARTIGAIALRERLRELALRDGLTGLYNRRFLDELKERLAREATRRKSSLSAIMLDLDHFKQINDMHGHAAGDAVLRAVAGALVGVLRCTDLMCRYGGEEMLIMLPDCSLGDAMERAERLRARVRELSAERDIPAVTASFGVASIPETSTGATDLLAAADAALYQAKRSGRDRVIAAASRPAAQTISLIALNG